MASHGAASLPDGRADRARATTARARNALDMGSFGGANLEASSAGFQKSILEIDLRRLCRARVIGIRVAAYSYFWAGYRAVCPLPPTPLPGFGDLLRLRVARSRCLGGEELMDGGNGRLPVLGESICPYCGVG